MSEREEVLVVDDAISARLNVKQWSATRAANDPSVDHVGLGGSIGAGKTQWGGRQITAWAWRYPADYLVVRKTTRRLEDSTKKAMLKGDGGLPPCVPTDLYHLHDLRVVDNEVRLKSGGVIKFRHAENALEAIDAFKNMTLGGYFIDQVEELDENEYEDLFNTLQGRLRAPGTPAKGLTVSNPAGTGHWYHRRIVDEATRDDGAAYVHVTLFDNEKNLPKKYVAQMKATERSRPDWYRRYILGQWGEFGGKRFKCFNEDLHVVKPFGIPSEWEIIEGIDYGWADRSWSKPFVCEWMAIDPFGRRFLVAELARAETAVSAFAREMKEVRAAYGLQPSSIWLDPSCWASRGEYASVASEFFDADILVAKAQNDRLGGWNHIEELLTRLVDDPDDPHDRSKALPGLVIFEGRCPQFQKELPNLKVRDIGDDVEKENDHASDATRYIVNARPPLPPIPAKDRQEELIERKLERLKRNEESLYQA